MICCNLNPKAHNFEAQKGKKKILIFMSLLWMLFVNKNFLVDSDIRSCDKYSNLSNKCDE